MTIVKEEPIDFELPDGNRAIHAPSRLLVPTVGLARVRHSSSMDTRMTFGEDEPYEDPEASTSKLLLETASSAPAPMHLTQAVSPQVEEKRLALKLNASSAVSTASQLPRQFLQPMKSEPVGLKRLKKDIPTAPANDRKNSIRNGTNGHVAASARPSSRRRKSQDERGRSHRGSSTQRGRSGQSEASRRMKSRASSYYTSFSTRSRSRSVRRKSRRGTSRGRSPYRYCDRKGRDRKRPRSYSYSSYQSYTSTSSSEPYSYYPRSSSRSYNNRKGRHTSGTYAPGRKVVRRTTKTPSPDRVEVSRKMRGQVSQPDMTGPSLRARSLGIATRSPPRPFQNRLDFPDGTLPQQRQRSPSGPNGRSLSISIKGRQKSVPPMVQPEAYPASGGSQYSSRPQPALGWGRQSVNSNSGNASSAGPRLAGPVVVAERQRRAYGFDVTAHNADRGHARAVASAYS